MRWARIKNIIILLLVIVNGFLLTLVGVRAWRTEQGARETRTRMVEILANNGIEFLPEEVPGALELSPWQVRAQRPGLAQATALVGEVTETETTAGGVTYVGPRGTVTLSSDGAVEASFAAGGWSADREQVDATVVELLSALEVPSSRMTSRREEDDAVTVTVTQLWEGAPIFGQSLTFFWQGGEFIYLSGRYLRGSGELASAGGSITAPTALSRFLTALNDGGYVCSQITGLYAGYIPSGSETVSLAPAWFIETDVWPRQFAVDGLTGAVTAAE